MLQEKKIETTWKEPNAQQAKGREVGAREFEGCTIQKKKIRIKGVLRWVTQRVLL